MQQAHSPTVSPVLVSVTTTPSDRCAMQTALRAHPPTLLIVGVVAALLVAESNCFSPQQSVQQIIDKDLGPSEATISMVVNQIALLKILNESTTICSLHEKELQERLNRSNDLDAKTQQVKNELDAKTQQVTNELDTKTRRVTNDLEVKTQRMTDDLEAKTQRVTDEIEAKTQKMTNDLEVKTQRVTNELDGKRLQVTNEINEAKEAAILELRNMTVETMNEVKALLAEVKETIASVSRQVTTASLECDSGWSEYQLSCYKIFKTKVNQTTATARCRTLGAHLAIIGSEGENSFVHGLVSDRTYIGLYEEEEDVWTWQDGSPFSYSNWEENEPNESGGCVDIWPDSYWYDRDCADPWHYVCEKSLV